MSWFPGGSGLTAADFAVFALLAAAFVALGRRAGEGVSTPDEYLLGGRRLPWATAGLALVAAEISALTVTGVPAAAFREDWTYLQFFFGAIAARLVVAEFFVPAFHLFGGETPYAFLGGRFGPWTRSVTAASFLGTRLLSSSVRLLAACVTAGALLGWSPWPVLILFTVAGAAALARGGVRAAAWTGALQTAVILGVAFLSVIFLLRRTDGGIGAAWSLALGAGKFHAFDWGPAGFWAAALTGFFGSAAAFGADQEMTQKLLAVKDAAEARKAMLLSIAGSALMLTLSLLIGTLLWVFFKQNPGMALPASVDQVYPHLAATLMPRIMRGLVLSSVFLASVDAPLASLSSVWLVDLRRPFTAAPDSPAAELDLARKAAWAFAVLTAVLAAVFGTSEGALSTAFKAGAVSSGPLLGVFAFGLSTDRRGDAPVAASFLGVCGLDILLLAASERGMIPFSWGWLGPCGAVAAYGLAWALTRPDAPRA